jgi:hypothetical protein
MWILPKNISDTYPCVQDTKGLGMDSEEFSQMCERSLMWRSKHTPSLTWLRRWKRVRYIQHLCSRTLKNSHSESFVDVLTSSLEDSLANHSVPQGNEKGLKTQDTCSPTSSKGSKSADLPLFSWRMSRGSSAVRQPMESQFSSMSSEAWKKWVTQQRQEYSQRVKLEHHTRGNGSSSWPTPTARDVKGPSGRAYKGKPENLADIELGNWPTPTVAEGGKIGNNPNYGQLGLSNHPQVHGYEVQRKPLHKDRKGLPKAGQQDPTKNSMSGKSQESWGTPSTRDTSHPGKNSNQKRITAQISNPNKLNPSWVEQLMGLPVGWTQLPIEWID